MIPTDVYQRVQRVRGNLMGCMSLKITLCKALELLRIQKLTVRMGTSREAQSLLVRMEPNFHLYGP